MDTSSDNLRMLADSVRDYVARGYGSTVRAASLAHPDACDPARWQEFAELGWLALPLPEDMGGLGGAMAELCAVCEQMGRGLVREPYVACAVGAAAVLDAATRHDAAPLRGDWGARLAEGRMRMALATGEPGMPPTVRALPMQPLRFVLQGDVQGVVGGAGADAFLVAAVLGAGREGLFLVEAAVSGLQAAPQRWHDGQVAASLRLHEVAAVAVWTGSTAQRHALLACARQRTRLAEAAQAVGLAQGAFDTTLEYLKTRRQFGRSIASNQVVQHRLVDLHVEICELRALVQATAALLDAQAPGTERHLAALAATVATTSRHVWEEAVQLHGAIGMTQENPLAPYVHRLAVAANAHGHAEAHLEDLAALVLDAPAALPA